MRHLIIAALWAALGACHVARLTPPQPTCSDNAVVSCESCSDRGCSWCSQGPNPSDGYCCDTGKGCSNPIRNAAECAPIPDCERAVVNSCGACLERNCAWCPGEARCRARGQEGTFPSCEGRVSGTAGCPAPTPGAEP